jgi:hypothetical protein
LVACRSLRGRRGLEKQALPRAEPLRRLFGWRLSLRLQPEQSKGCAEEVDGRVAIGDQG